MEKLQLRIPGRLPGLNDLICHNRSHWAEGARLKRETDMKIRTSIRCQVPWRLPGKSGALIQEPVHIHFEWHEGNRRRDLDNIYSAKKYVLDALQEAGVIMNDSQKYVTGLSDEFILNRDWEGVVVTLSFAGEHPEKEGGKRE